MKKMFKMVADYLGITSFSMEDGKKILTSEQKAKLTETFGADFVAQFEGKLADDDEEDSNTELTSQITSLEAQLQEAQSALTQATESNSTQATTIATFESQIQELQSSIALLSASDDDAPKPTVVEADAVVNHSVALFAQTDKPYMLLENRPWNQRAAAALAARQGQVIIAASSVDYSQLAADLGAYYRTGDQTLRSIIREMPTVEKIFPLHGGYQDQHVLVNAFLGEFSQAFQNDFTPKGTYDIEPEIVQMRNVKFDHKFTELKEMEKQWIGFLNREGSNAIKWSFVEYLLAETAKKLHNEREQRRISGVYIPPVAGVAGQSINGSDGLRQFIKNKINNLQIKPFVMGEWEQNTIANYVFDGSMQIPQDIRDTGALVVYGSTDAKIYYNRNIETLRGRNTNYDGAKDKIEFLNDITFIGVPNMGNSKRLIWSVDGNICLFEDKPDEMFAFEFEREDRTLKVWSDWREATHAFIVGKKWDNAAEMDYTHQLIWCNDVDEPSTYFIDIAPDVTEPSVKMHTSLKTGINTQETIITDILDLEIGQQCILKCGSDNVFNSKIEVTGNFADLSEAWNPELGDTITLYRRTATDIVDLGRTSASSDAAVLPADATVINAQDDVNFVTSANTVPTEITTINNATAGVEYTIFGGDDANASTMTDGGEFALSADITLNTGVYVKLYCRADHDFVELERG